MIVFIVALLARFGLKLNLLGANYVLLALFGGLLFAGSYRKRIRTYSYNYNTTIRFKSIASPNTDKNLFGDPRCALIHTKLFIIDSTLLPAPSISRKVHSGTTTNAFCPATIPPPFGPETT